MTHFHRMILRMLPAPFFGALGVLMFLLLMQFLIKYLPDLVGKGLPFLAIVELIIYNLAYMLVLAVPMSVLIATMVTYGRLGESNAYLVTKSAGVSLLQLIWPTLIVGGFLTAGMAYFNNEVLPEANFRAKNLWFDIRAKRPDFELQAGAFYDGLNQYSILIKERPPESDRLYDITIYDYTGGSRQQVLITAEEGQLRPIGDGIQLDLLLYRGEVHQIRRPSTPRGPERYERLTFSEHRLRLDLSDFIFERRDPRETSRSDRTMRTAEMVQFVDSLDASVAKRKGLLFSEALARFDPAAFEPPPVDEAEDLPVPQDTTPVVPSPRRSLAGLTQREQSQLYDLAMQEIRGIRTEIDNMRGLVKFEADRADRYRVEIHKKQSIALACLIFMLVGAPIGLSIRRGSLGTTGALSTLIFVFYWVTLVQGEKLADRGLIAPWVGMWGANMVMFMAGLILMVYVILDLRATPSLWRRLRETLRR